MPAKKYDDALLLDIQRLIHLIRDQRVMLDSDLAKLYGVTTASLNQSVERNRDRFPNDFAFQLTLQEFRSVRATFDGDGSGFGGRRKMPWVFTEHGVAMLSSVLRSKTAVRVNIEIMRAFVQIRRLLATPGELVAQLQQLAEVVKLHDDQIRAINDVLRKMLESPPVPPSPKRRIGFYQNPPAEESRE